MLFFQKSAFTVHPSSEHELCDMKAESHTHTYLISVMSPSLQKDVALPALLLNVGMA